jgi:hypothetical protein
MRFAPSISNASRGSAIVEFAVAFGLLLTFFAGVWQFGYAFYAYNQLEGAVRNAARYGSLAEYDGGSWNGVAFRTRVQNMAVFGVPTPDSSDRPILPGLQTSHVRVTPILDGEVPRQIQVDIDDYQIETFFQRFLLRGKPRATFDYMGRYTAP